MRFLPVAVAGLVASATPAFATYDAPAKGCSTEYKKFQKSGGLHKAFALATKHQATKHYPIGQACGWSRGKSSKELAIGHALTICRKYADKYKIRRSECRVFAVE